MFSGLARLPWDAITGLAAVVGLVASGVYVVITQLVPWFLTKHRSRSLSRAIGAEQFSLDTLQRALRNYVEPMCGQVDPADREDFRSLFPLSKALFDVLDDIVHGRGTEYIVILADSGMGKTTALLNYFARNHRRWFHRKPVAILSLGVAGTIDQIAGIPDPQKTVLFLDALDEDVAAVADHKARVADLVRAARGFRAIVISCRTQFFTKDEEITNQTGVLKIGPVAAGEAREYVFQKVYLLPFSSEQINLFLRRRYPLFRWSARRRARGLVQRVQDLTARPMLLAYIDDLIQRGERFDRLSDAYESIVDAWLKRDDVYVGDVVALRGFSERLAVELYVGRERRGGEHAPAADLAALAADWHIPLETWKLTGRSLLNRDALGNYKFAHRSIMEYLFVKRAIEGDPDCMSTEWTAQMCRFLAEAFIAGRGFGLERAAYSARQRGSATAYPMFGSVIRQTCSVAIRGWLWRTGSVAEMLSQLKYIMEQFLVNTMDGARVGVSVFEFIPNGTVDQILLWPDRAANIRIRRHPASALASFFETVRKSGAAPMSTHVMSGMGGERKLTIWGVVAESGAIIFSAPEIMPVQRDMLAACFGAKS